MARPPGPPLRAAPPLPLPPPPPLLLLLLLLPLLLAAAALPRRPCDPAELPPDTVLGRPGGNVTLRCGGEGLPNDSVSWELETRRGRRLAQGAALPLRGLQRGDAGRYSCRRGGRPPRTLRLLVQDPPEAPRVSCYRRSHDRDVLCEWPLRAKPAPGTRATLWVKRRFTAENATEQQCRYFSKVQKFVCRLTVPPGADDNKPLVVSTCVRNGAGSAAGEDKIITLSGVRALPPRARPDLHGGGPGDADVAGHRRRLGGHPARGAGAGAGGVRPRRLERVEPRGRGHPLDRSPRPRVGAGALQLAVPGGGWHRRLRGHAAPRALRGRPHRGGRRWGDPGGRQPPRRGPLRLPRGRREPDSGNRPLRRHRDAVPADVAGGRAAGGQAGRRGAARAGAAGPPQPQLPAERDPAAAARQPPGPGALPRHQPGLFLLWQVAGLDAAGGGRGPGSVAAGPPRAGPSPGPVRAAAGAPGGLGRIPWPQRSAESLFLQHVLGKRDQTRLLNKCLLFLRERRGARSRGAGGAAGAGGPARAAPRAPQLQETAGSGRGHRTPWGRRAPRGAGPAL